MSKGVRETYEEEQSKKALKMIKAIEKRIKSGKLKVMTYGYWEGVAGKWTFSIVARESDDLRPYIEVP